MSSTPEELDSSLIVSVSYQADHERLEIAFTNGSCYHYYGVPAEIYEALLKAESAGSFFNLYIKEGGYEYAHIA